MLQDLLHNSLKLPLNCWVNQKLPKTFFKRNFELTLSEKKLLDDFSIIQQMDVLALVNQETANIAAFTEPTSSYEEIIILAVETTSEQFDKQKHKISQFVQKYIPNPVLLIIYGGKKLIFSVAEKRVNSNDATKRVIEKEYVTQTIIIDAIDNRQEHFFENLAFDKANKLDLRQYYNHFIQSVVGLQTAQINGTFVARPIEQSKENVLILEQIQTLQEQINSLEHIARKETQVSEMVKLNTKINENRIEIKQLTEKLNGTIKSA